MNTEEWKDIPGFEGIYQASTLGRVKSLARQEKRKGNHFLPERILKGNVDRNGYTRVCLQDRRKHLVHRLIAQTFLETTDREIQVNHKNGLRSDNRLLNLEWVTPSDNIKHSFTSLKRVPLKGSEVGNSKLNLEDIHIIRTANKSGMTANEIHLQYYPCMSYGTISDIVARRRWSHV